MPAQAPLPSNHSKDQTAPRQCRRHCHPTLHSHGRSNVRPRFGGHMPTKAPTTLLRAPLAAPHVPPNGTHITCYSHALSSATTSSPPSHSDKCTLSVLRRALLLSDHTSAEIKVPHSPPLWSQNAAPSRCSTLTAPSQVRTLSVLRRALLLSDHTSAEIKVLHSGPL